MGRLVVVGVLTTPRPNVTIELNNKCLRWEIKNEHVLLLLSNTPDMDHATCYGDIKRTIEVRNKSTVAQYYWPC